MALYRNTTPITKEAKEYADHMVGPRGERMTMDNTYEWDAIAAAFSSGQASAWINKTDRMPPYGQTVIAIHRCNDGKHRIYVHKAGDADQEERMVAWMPLPGYPTPPSAPGHPPEAQRGDHFFANN